MSARNTSKIPHRNQSPYGWWIVSYLVRLERKGHAETNPRARCLAWENTVIFQAKDREKAYRKALLLARPSRTWDVQDHGPPTRWVLEGLTSLLPVYDPIADGCEVMWREFRGKTRKTVAAMVRSKRALACFDDSDLST